MNYNERLFNLLNEKNLKQSDLANILNVQKSVITSWKSRGTNPPLEYLVQICEFLNISVTEFLDINESTLSENEKELLNFFDKLPDREQIKWIARLEDAANKYKSFPEENSSIS